MTQGLSWSHPPLDRSSIWAHPPRMLPALLSPWCRRAVFAEEGRQLLLQPEQLRMLVELASTACAPWFQHVQVAAEDWAQAGGVSANHAQFRSA
jgi:hypothetical protein